MTMLHEEEILVEVPEEFKPVARKVMEASVPGPSRVARIGGLVLLMEALRRLKERMARQSEERRLKVLPSSVPQKHS